jgi:hypothetical protein
MSPPESVYDIWTASLYDRDLILGAHKQAVYVPDPGTNAGAFTRLKTSSDVLALAQAPHLTYAGTRNGNVTRFDLRAPRGAGTQLFATPAGAAVSGAVTADGARV